MNGMAELVAAFDEYARLLGDAKMSFPYGTRPEYIGAINVKFFSRRGDSASGD
jgi:hypothetical protein